MPEVDWPGLVRELPRERQTAAALMIDEPTLPVAELATRSSATHEDVLSVYQWARASGAFRAAIGSAYYRHRQKWAFGAKLQRDWLLQPDWVERLRNGSPVLSSTVEIHPSLGDCAYSCSMCLWSNKADLTYETRGLTERGLVRADQWCNLIGEFRAEGARTLVVSGGGEALLNPDLPRILGHAVDLGFRVELYTTGMRLAGSHSLLSAISRIARVRFSVHSPSSRGYNDVAGLPAESRALASVANGIRRLLERRPAALEVGIGCVVLQSNASEILDMAQFAADLGVDFIDFRQDEVAVTDGFSSPRIRELVRRQVVELRRLDEAGEFNGLRVDLGDDLVALANGETVGWDRQPQCLAKAFRPAVSPFGIVAPCDLKAEPRFASEGLSFGEIVTQGLSGTLAEMAVVQVPDTCEQCMPSSRTGNALLTKLLTDLESGVSVVNQPFVSAAA